MKWTLSLLSGALITFLFHFAAAADNPDPVQGAAQTIIQRLAAKQYQQVWDEDTSSWFKQRATSDQFVANMTMGRSPLGDLKKMILVSEDHAAGDPASGYKGDVYSVTFRDTYSVGDFFERVVLINEGGRYLLSGIWGVPAK